MVVAELVPLDLDALITLVAIALVAGGPRVASAARTSPQAVNELISTALSTGRIRSRRRRAKRSPALQPEADHPLASGNPAAP